MDGGTGDPIILCSEDKKEERLRLRKKVVMLESNSTNISQNLKKVKRKPNTKTQLLKIQISDENIAIPNPYKCKELEKLPKVIRKYHTPTHRWSLVSDLKKRNQVADILECKKQLTKDGDFLMLVQGRPIKDKLVRCEYTGQIKKRLLNNVLSGFIHDEIRMKEEQDINISSSIQKVQQDIDSTLKSMADFLTAEQKGCENISKNLDGVIKCKEQILAMIENEKKKMSEVKLKIFRHSEDLETMRKCREFILEVAPKEWKEDFAEDTRKRQAEVKDETNKLRDAVANYKNRFGGKDLGFEEVLDEFVIEFSTAGPPLLPFSDPKMIFNLFKDLEIKNLRALQNNEIMKEMVSKSKSIFEAHEKYLLNEKVTIEETLQEVKDKIAEEQHKLDKKKKLLQTMLDEPFRELVASEEVLEEYVMVKNVYEEVIQQPQEGLNTIEMLQEIGELYIDLNRSIEHIPAPKRKFLKMRVKQDLEKEMKEAEKAEKRKTQVKNMVKALQRAKEKPWKPTGRTLLSRQPIDKESTITINKEIIKESRIEKLGKCEEPDEALPLVWSYNHQEPGPYKTPETISEHDYRDFLPDLQLEDTEESEQLLSESEEEQEKIAENPANIKEKKVKRKKRVIIDISDSDSD